MEKARDGSYLEISERYQAQLRLHGDTAEGAGWPNEIDRQKRFAVMLEFLDRAPLRSMELLDFGCGTGELLSHIQRVGPTLINYKGVDISPLAIRLARQKFPGTMFYELDLLQASEGDLSIVRADYCIANGVFTVKFGLRDDQMWAFFVATIERLWSVVRRGIAFNVMSKQVDWERDDLFHVSLDKMANFLHKLAGRSIIFRCDYGLHEYTCYVRKEVSTSSFPLDH